MFATLEARPRRPSRPVAVVAPPPPAPQVEIPSPVSDSSIRDRLLANRHFQPALIASNPAKVIGRRPFGGSLLLHLAFGALIIVFTRPAAVETAAAADTTLFFLPRVRALETREPAKPQPTPAGGGGAGGALVVVGSPPPRGFQTVIAPTMIPAGIPEVKLDERPLDPRNYTGIGVEGGVSYGVQGGTGRVDPDLVAGLEGVIFAEATADTRYERAEVLEQKPPRYPGVLRTAGIEGFVEVRFVIDTAGRVEPNSADVIESTHPMFEEPALQAVIAARFIPARLAGRTVRQLTSQRVSFKLE